MLKYAVIFQGWSCLFFHWIGQNLSWQIPFSEQLATVNVKAFAIYSTREILCLQETSTASKLISVVLKDHFMRKHRYFSNCSIAFFVLDSCGWKVQKRPLRGKGKVGQTIKHMYIKSHLDQHDQGIQGIQSRDGQLQSFLDDDHGHLWAIMKKQFSLVDRLSWIIANEKLRGIILPNSDKKKQVTNHPNLRKSILLDLDTGCWISSPSLGQNIHPLILKDT